MKKKKYKRKNKGLKFLIYLIVIILTLVVIFEYRTIAYNEEQKLNEIKEEQERKEKEERERKYNTCMNTPYKDDSIDTMFEELLETTNAAIYFKDINNNYTLTSRENASFYGASLIKLYLASYLIENARAGNIDLNTTITYTYNYSLYHGRLLSTRTVGEEITLSDLIYYSISVSDNGAYMMLSDYVGVTPLRNYANNLFGTNLTISEGDRFSYLTVSDTNKLLEYVYDLIQVDDEYSNLLINAMNNTYFNSLNFDDKTFLHKYGYYNLNYNDIGIYNSDNPYLISIFTLYGPDEEYMFDQTRKISKSIYEIYQTNLDLKEEYCTSLAYPEENKTMKIDTEL